MFETDSGLGGINLKLPAAVPASTSIASMQNSQSSSFSGVMGSASVAGVVTASSAVVLLPPPTQKDLVEHTAEMPGNRVCGLEAFSCCQASASHVRVEQVCKD